MASIDEVAELELDIVGEPDWPTEGFGSIWAVAADQEEPAVVRIDPEDGTVLATIRTPRQICQGMGFTEEAAWACTSDGVVRIDPETNEITGEVAFETGAAYGRLASDGTSLWALGATSGVVNQLVRIDPTAMTASAIPLGHPASTLAHGFDAVWIASTQDGVLLRVDPATEAITEHVTGLNRPQVVVAGPDSLWVMLQGSEESAPDATTVVRIDPEEGAVLAEIATGAAAWELWAADDAVWVCSRELFLSRVDPATNEVVDRLSGPTSTCAVTVAFGSVWATAGNALKVYRFAP